MSTTAKCNGSTPLPYRSTEDGWPHGRRECPACHGFYVVRNDGALRSHVPHRGDNAYEAEQRAQLNPVP